LSPHDDDLLLDVAGYAVGTLDRAERERFETHLAGCDACRTELSELAPVADLARRAEPLPVPPPGLGVRTLLAVERAATAAEGEPAPEAAPAPRRRRGSRRLRLPRLALAGAALAAALLAVVLIRQADAPGRLEAEASLAAPGGGAQASADLFFTGIGRVIAFNTDDLPILPKTEYYELWFVGPRDRPGAPDRISAGTFHPDEEGRSRVDFTAAVDPKRYPRLAVTAEPGDGDPAPSGPDVLRGRVELR